MGDYISREAAHAAIRKSMPTIGQSGQMNAILSMTLAGVAVDVNAVPAADVVPVVRCKDCDRRIHSADLTTTVLCPWFGEHQMDKMSFCSDGIRSNVHARWDIKSYPDEEEGKPFTMEFFVCSNCGERKFFYFEKKDKCPKCHAIMDKEATP